MKILIEIFEEEVPYSSNKLYGAEIFLNKKWFKEISGLSSREDVLKAIADNEDLLTEIKK